MMLFKLQLFSTLVLSGLILTIQFIHYPLWKYVTKDKLISFEKAHQKLITPIVTVLMLIEAFSAVMLLKSYNPVFLINFIALIGIWLSTFFLQVPMHQRILKGIDSDRSIEKLIQSNYIRTFLWLFRGVLLTFFSNT